MELFLMYATFVFIIYIAIKSTPVVLAILLNINLFRAIPYVNYKFPNYGYYNENDIVLGAILPITCFLIIFLKIVLKTKQIKYHTDVFDVFILLLSIVMLVSILFSPDKLKSIVYSGIFIFLSLPFYVAAKFHFLNTKDYKGDLHKFFSAIVFFAIMFALVSLYLHNIAKYPYERMTFPGVYPIAFCLFLCTALIIVIIYYIKPSFKKELSKKNQFIFAIPVLGIIIFSIIKTNTRGPVFAILLCFIVMLMLFFKIKLHTKIIMSALISLFIGFVTLISAFDVEKIAKRFINLVPADANSFSPRILAYLDSVKILLIRPWGISVGTFGQFYSDQDSLGADAGAYSHNLFMELISSFGLLGVFLSFFLIYIFLFEYNFIIKNQKKIFSDHLFFISIILLVFFFFETQFSFTLNTHKGFYLSMALYAISKFKFLKHKYNEG
jgi:O-antigen ligase